MKAVLQRVRQGDLRYVLLDYFARKWPAVSRTGETVAVFSPGHLGDILHAVPMLRALREGRPTAKIIWLVGPWSQALAQRYAALANEIRVFGPAKPRFSRGKREWRQSFLAQGLAGLALRRAGVGTLIAPMDDVGRFLANACAPKLWTGIGDRRPPRVGAEIQTQVQPYEKDRYEADAWTGLLQPLGITAHADQLEYAVAAGERQAADEFLKAEGVDMERPLVLIAPGSGWSGKNWLPERFGEVAAWLATERGAQIAWIGGPDEAGLVPEDRAGDFCWFGKVSLATLTAAMARARLFIGNDGGLLHLAAALRLPTVSLWGPTSPEKWGPRGSRHRQIRKMERCAGCIYWDYREQCRHDQACMKAIAVADVLRAVGDVWTP